MSRKLGRVMSSSRMITFVAFLCAVFAWVFKMPVLLTVSIAALVVSSALYINDKYRKSKLKKSA